VLYACVPQQCDALFTNQVMWYTHTMRSAPPHTSAPSPPSAYSAASWPTTCQG
jgi:hypothetical protein